MTQKHVEPGIVTPEEVLLRWPLKPVPRHLSPDEAHQQAVEFKKQSGASADQIHDLMHRYNGGLDLDIYFGKKLEAIDLERENDPANGAGT